MMKALVIEKFVDKYYGVTYTKGSIINVSEERFMELAAKGKVQAYIEPEVEPKDEDEGFITPKKVKGVKRKK